MDNSNGTNNIIGEGSELKGNLSTASNIRLEGKVIGNIKSSSKVACGETSTVDGNVIAENAEIAGKITGKVNVTELLMTAYMSAEQGQTITFPPPELDTFIPAVARGEWNPRSK